MSLSSSEAPGLDGPHPGCAGQEFSKCAPFRLQTGELGVVLMVWCGDCGAADYEVV